MYRNPRSLFVCIFVSVWLCICLSVGGQLFHETNAPNYIDFAGITCTVSGSCPLIQPHLVRHLPHLVRHLPVLVRLPAMHQLCLHGCADGSVHQLLGLRPQQTKQVLRGGKWQGQLVNSNVRMF